MSGAQKASAVAKGHINSSPASVVAGTSGTGAKTSKPSGTAATSNTAAQKPQATASAAQNTVTVTRTTNSSADNAPTGMTGSSSTYLSGNFSSWNNTSSSTSTGQKHKSNSWTSSSSSSSSSSSNYSSGGSSYSNNTDYRGYPHTTQQTDFDENQSSEIVLFSNKQIKTDDIATMQRHKGTSIDDEMYGTHEKRNMKAENLFKVAQILLGTNDIDLGEYAVKDVKVKEKIPNKFSTAGCKIDGTAIAISTAIGSYIDIAEINKFDKNQDGFFTPEETLEAFANYLSDDKTVEYDYWKDKLNKDTLDTIASYGDEIYILGRARSVVEENDTHWVLLYGYHMNENKQVQFEFVGTSYNDKNRNYILGKPLENQKGSYFSIDFIQTYTIKDKK